MRINQISPILFFRSARKIMNIKFTTIQINFMSWGIGPGDIMLLTFVAKEAIMNSDAIVGYNKTCIGLIKEPEGYVYRHPATLLPVALIGGGHNRLSEVRKL